MRSKMVVQELQPPQHFLVVAYRFHSHINPSLQLARTLTRFGVRVTFSTAVSAHRRMFPDKPFFPIGDPLDPLLSYYPYSDGFDDGYDGTDGDVQDFISSFRSVSSETLHALATDSSRPPITCMIHGFLFPWVADIANAVGVPSVLCWIQSAAVFAVYHHYFHGHRELINSHADDASLLLELPGLPPLKSRDLPSFFLGGQIFDTTNQNAMLMFEEMFEALEIGAKEEKPRVIINTFEELERDAVEAMREVVELVPVGPVLNGNESCRSGMEVVTGIANADESINGWLDKWPDKSVVCLSFGSISTPGRKQREELACALVECGRPFLWVAREERDGVEAAEGVERGKVVGWCNQVEVLAHRAVGCLVTHHGWNSTLEAINCGVPMVGLPQWSDQPTNAKLVEGLWGVGVRAEVNVDGVVEGKELKRCLEAVMGGGEEAVEIRKRAEMWKEKAREAAKEGGPSDQNLKAFVEGVACPGV